MLRNLNRTLPEADNIRPAVLAAAAGLRDLVTVRTVVILLGSVLMIGFQLIEGAKVKNKTRAAAGDAARILDIFDYEPRGWNGDVVESGSDDAGPAS